MKTNRDYSSTSINKLKREGGEEGNLYEKNGDHSTESAHERFLFTSSDTSNPSELFNASQLVNKNRSSTFHGMMFLFHTYWDFFSLTDTFQRMEANDRGNTSLVRSETRTIVLRSVNLPLYEINYILWPQNVHWGYSGGGTKASLSKKNLLNDVGHRVNNHDQTISTKGSYGNNEKTPLWRTCGMRLRLQRNDVWYQHCHIAQVYHTWRIEEWSPTINELN